jgi:hypothetical protein
MSYAVRVFLLVLAAVLLPSIADAQATTSPSAPATSPQQTAADVPDPDLQLNPSEPDFTLGALPTTLRLPAGKFAFRMAHRFSRPIASGSAGDFFADFFGFDSSARIGLEVRYGVRSGTQVVFHRTNDRAIQFAGQQSLLHQGEERPFSLDALVAVEGVDNFSEEFSGTFGVLLSRQFGSRGAAYFQPIAVVNADPDGEDEHTMLAAVGIRLRLGASRVYVVAEAAPQVAGYRDGVDHVSFGIEKRAGGHVFQFTVSNSLGTTFRQIARGGLNRDDWFVGFNLTRRFF